MTIFLIMILILLLMDDDDVDADNGEDGLDDNDLVVADDDGLDKVDDDGLDRVESYISSGSWNPVTHQLSALLCLASNKVGLFRFLRFLHKYSFLRLFGWDFSRNRFR